VKSLEKFLLGCGSTVILLNLGMAQSHPGEWFTVGRDDLCVTEGAIEKTESDRMSVNDAKMRACVITPSAQSVEIRFRYAGPTGKESALASGQMRRQFGLKLDAQDPCNLIYAMWRIAPESKLVVSLKRNRTEHTSAQCGNHGYTNIKPRKSSGIPHLEPGESHTLRAEMKQEELSVFVDNREVWQGDIGPDAAELDGPVGIRSDNARLEFDLKARQSEDHRRPWPCRSGDSD
jgi:hypothetical protein